MNVVVLSQPDFLANISEEQFAQMIVRAFSARILEIVLSQVRTAMSMSEQMTQLAIHGGHHALRIATAETIERLNEQRFKEPTP